MEFRDLYTKDGVFTGEIREKHADRRAGEYFLHSIVILRTESGKYVPAQRSFKAKFFPGQWDVTGGGVISGETPVEAAVREAREELGIHLTPEKMAFLYRYRSDFSGGNGLWVYVYGAVFDSSSGYQIDPYEVEAVQEVEFEDYYQMVMTNKDDEFASALRRFHQMHL